MKKFKLPTELGSDFKNPSIIKVKEIVNEDSLNSERTFTSDCCCNTQCHHCGNDYCLCQCVIDTGCHLNPF
ncbi:MAG: hypothetical protein H6Q15_2492 [Bacteroidetes bacterium]|nr:hypothetical protein [Bacteroidota bacterium]